MTTQLHPQRLVVPVDVLTERTTVVAIAQDIARRLGADVEIVTVVRPGGDAVEQSPLSTTIDGVTITSRLVWSESIDQPLIEYAQDDNALMCLAASGRTAVVETITGSVSASLLHHTLQPLLVVGPQCAAAFRGTHLAIAVDGTHEGNSIIEAALDLAELLHLTPMIYQVLSKESRAIVADAFESAYVAHLAHAVSRPGLDVQYDVLHDHDISRGLSRLTDDVNIAIVAMASHGHSPSERLLLPSIAHQFIRHARCPVLLGPRVTPIEAIPYGSGRRVVVGIDGTDADAGVLAVAADQAIRHDARLDIVHAWTQTWAMSPDGTSVATDFESEQATAQATLDKAAAAARYQTPTLTVTPWLILRLPSDALLEAAVGAEQLVVGEHRYNRLERWVLGSTTEDLLHRSPIPIIVVPEWADVVASDGKVSAC